MQQTSGADVVELFTSSGNGARRALDRWRRREGLGYVAEAVLSHTTGAASADTDQAVRRGDSAPAQVRLY